MSEFKADQCIVACTQLMAKSLYCADHHDDAGFLGLLSDDVVIELRGTKLEAKAGVQQYLTSRPKERVTRHVFSPPGIEMTSENTAKGVLYFVLYEAQKGDDEGQGFYPMTAPVAVGEYHDTFTLTADGWRIASRKIVPVFRG